MTMTVAEIKRGRKFDQVLTGARDVFMRDGYEGASVDEIARVAGVSKATLYSYFPDKRLLFSEVARIECNRQAEAAMEVIDIDAPVEDAVHEAVDRIVRFFLTDFGCQVYRTCIAESHRFPELGARFYESGPELVRERVGAVLRTYVERGALRIEDIDLAAMQLAELCKSDLFTRKLCGIESDFTEAEIARVVDGAVEMFMARYAA